MGQQGCSDNPVAEEYTVNASTDYIVNIDSVDPKDNKWVQCATTKQTTIILTCDLLLVWLTHTLTENLFYLWIMLNIWYNYIFLIHKQLDQL